MTEEARRNTGLRPRYVLGARVSAVAESIAFISIALIIDYFLFSGARYSNISPHPFWFIVLLTATYYGTNEGLFAAGLSTLALLAHNLPEQLVDEDLAGWLLRVTKEPVLWFGAALILGEISLAKRREADALREDVERLKKCADDIAVAYEQAAASVRDLEQRIASQTRTLRVLTEAADIIEQPTKKAVIRAIPELVRRLLAPRKFSVFIADQRDALSLSAQEGWQPNDPFVREISTGPLWTAICERREVLVVSDPDHEASLCGQGLIAAPIQSRATGELLGMLKIEDIDFERLNLSTLLDIQIICSWVGSAYDRAESDAKFAYASAGVLPSHNHREGSPDSLLVNGCGHIQPN